MNKSKKREMKWLRNQFKIIRSGMRHYQQKNKRKKTKEDITKGRLSQLTGNLKQIGPVSMNQLSKKMERENKRKADQIQNLEEVNFIDEEAPAPKSPTNVQIIEDSDEEEEEESKPEPPKPRPKSKKSILKLIEDSDEEEPDPEEVFVRLKIIK